MAFLLGFQPVSGFGVKLVGSVVRYLSRILSVLFVFAFFFFNNSLYWDAAGSISASIREVVLQTTPVVRSQGSHSAVSLQVPGRVPAPLHFRARSFKENRQGNLTDGAH